MGQVGSCEQEVMEGAPLKRRKTEADLALAVPRMTLKTSQSARRPPKRAKEDNARSVRPRPLHVNDKMRVLWQGRDPEWDELDGGAFARWLQSCDSAAQAKKEAEPSVKPQVLVVGHSFKTLPEDDAAQEDGLAPPLPADAGGDPIDVPRCRQLSKSRRSIDGGPSKSEGSFEGPYVRYVSPDGDGVESRVEYDMDDEDEEWLARFSGQGGSRGPRALSEDTFEMLVDHFEKALHSLLQRRVELWPAVTDPALELPDISGMYTLEQACESEDLAHISKAVKGAVYKHWCKKREKAKQPLLQRLWFEQPWVRARDAGKEALPGVHKSNDSELPFMGQDAPRPPTTRPRRMNAEEALFKLESIRTELETIRTMADQVRRRERGKKRELLLVRDERRRRARLAPDGTNDEAGPSKPGVPGGLPAVLPPDREARLATKAAAKVAREAATLVTAQVMLDPSGPNDRAPSAEPSAAAASRQAEKKESLHKPSTEHTGECFWCKQGGNLAGCSICPRCFCFSCYKVRPGYGIVNWGRMLRASEFSCAICSGREPASCEGDSVDGFVRKGFSMLPQLHGLAVVRGRGRGRGRGHGRGGGHSLQRLIVEAPSPADIKPAVKPEAGSSDASLQAAVHPAVKPAVATAARPAKQVAKVGRKQQAAPARDGLRHTKQNYEKLAGVKRSRTKAAASRRLVISARRAPAVRRALPSRHSELPATKGRKPPLQRRAPPVPPRLAHLEAKKPQPDAKSVLPEAKKAKPLNKQAQPDANRAQPEAKKPKLGVKKARLDVPALLEKPGTVKAPPQLADAPKVWKRPESVALVTVRGRGSSRGGHLRQGSTRQTLAGSGSRKSTNLAGAGSIRGVSVADAAAQGATKSTVADAPASGPDGQESSPCPTGIPGIGRALRQTTQPRRKARVEYVMSCRRHGTFRHDRVSRMVDFFAQHSVPGCRPEWAPLAQQPGESRVACEERLRTVFPFSSVAPLPGPLQGAASAAAARQPQAASASRPHAQPGKPSSVAGKGKPACKQPAGQRLDAGAKKSLLSVLERRNMSQPKGQAPPACGSAAAGTQPALQQQRLLSTTPKLTSKEASAPTRPVLKRDGCSKCRWKGGGCNHCRPTKELPSRKRARA